MPHISGIYTAFRRKPTFGIPKLLQRIRNSLSPLISASLKVTGVVTWAIIDTTAHTIREACQHSTISAFQMTIWSDRSRFRADMCGRSSRIDVWYLELSRVHYIDNWRTVGGNGGSLTVIEWRYRLLLRPNGISQFYRIGCYRHEIVLGPDGTNRPLSEKDVCERCLEDA